MTDRVPDARGDAAAVGAREPQVALSTASVYPESTASGFELPWRRDYSRNFVEGIARLEADSGVQFAVENMYPWRAPRRDVQAYVPGWNPVQHEFANVTLDLSHSATAGNNPVEMAAELGDRLAHVPPAAGAGSAKDEHLVPGRGNQPCGEFLEFCAASGFRGSVVVEINTRRSGSRALRQQDLAEALAFARLHRAGGRACAGRNRVAAAACAVGSDGTVGAPGVVGGRDRCVAGPGLRP